VVVQHFVLFLVMVMLMLLADRT